MLLLVNLAIYLAHVLACIQADAASQKLTLHLTETHLQQLPGGLSEQEA